MGQHSARRGEPSWFGGQDVETRDPDPTLPAVSPAWDSLDQPSPYPRPDQLREETLRRLDETGPPRCGTAWRPPQPRPRPSWSTDDFAAWSAYCHPNLGYGVCGCQTPACDVRAHLDLIDWGPAGPPLPASTR